jgi:hypothetical protein
MRKREEEKLRRRFSALSKIKQEISHYIAVGGVNRHTSHLKTILVELEKYPDVTEKDVQKLEAFSGLLERIKASARLEILAIRTLLEAELNSMRVGTHTRRDSSGTIASEIRVDRVLAVNILPALPARLMVIYQLTASQIVFGVCLSRDDVSSSVAKIEMPSNWNDPLEAILCQLDLFHSSADHHGPYRIGYDIHYSAIGSQTHIYFHNPTYSQFVDLERAFFSVAKTVTSKNSKSPENDYLVKWSKYLAK